MTRLLTPKPRGRETPRLIEQTLLRDLGWVMFEPNGEPLWSANRRNGQDFWRNLCHHGAGTVWHRAPALDTAPECCHAVRTTGDGWLHLVPSGSL
jgi:hypothetical protein